MRGEACTRSRWCLGSGVSLGLVAVLLPKCPVCIAGWLAVIGLGATMGIAIGELATPALALLAALFVCLWIVRR